MTAVADAFSAELRKVLTLPATLAALAVAVLGPVALAALTASRDPGGSAAEAALDAGPLVMVGAIVLGVVAVSSEYAAGRQIASTLAAVPRRVSVLAAKAAVVAGLVAAAAAVAFPAALLAARLVAGPGPDVDRVLGRAVGGGVYAVLTALIALAITVFARGGVVPLVVLIANGSVVSVSFLLYRATPLARYLPDLAGMRMLAGEDRLAIDDALGPVTGGLVMAAWTAALLAIAAVVLARRDA
ncbi:ABC transporter permease [Jiangella mangrovi]|uniref:ABC-type transport system involved in multi-copper enzyme maturation permease subunit n=1 Tax=Jiangella mangrovi TaxID=1524084 RepID=A0A7W9GTN5_9ACTN|nr:ABC transporter permease [Jiangella mangrovi]MBB5789843.1 ABC-type transport system involved in multi-copper enzyme maturation permease subunit [Jiangella mangrovi]